MNLWNGCKNKQKENFSGNRKVFLLEKIATDKHLGEEKIL